MCCFLLLVISIPSSRISSADYRSRPNTRPWLDPWKCSTLCQTVEAKKWTVTFNFLSKVCLCYFRVNCLDFSHLSHLKSNNKTSKVQPSEKKIRTGLFEMDPTTNRWNHNIPQRRLSYYSSRRGQLLCRVRPLTSGDPTKKIVGVHTISPDNLYPVWHSNASYLDHTVWNRSADILDTRLIDEKKENRVQKSK